jgi:hypothetical protein
MRQMKAIAGDGPQERYFGFGFERGQPAVRILEYVRAHPIDLVVIPAGGTSRPVGSMADQVLAEATCHRSGSIGRGALPSDDRHGCPQGLWLTRTGRV